MVPLKYAHFKPTPLFVQSPETHQTGDYDRFHISIYSTRHCRAN